MNILKNIMFRCLNRKSALLKIQSAKGNVLIETIITLPVLVILIGGFFVSTYLLFGHFCLNYRTHEDTICAAEQTALETCEEKSRKWLSHVLPFGQIKHLDIHRTPDHYSSWIELTLLPPIPIISRAPILLRREHWMKRDDVRGSFAGVR